MLVPTLPASRFLVLDDADMPSAVSLALAAERVGDDRAEPVIVPTWWQSGADEAMPLVHKAVERHASVYGVRRVHAELVVEPSDEPGSASVLSQLLLAAVPLALREGCDAILFPIRPALAQETGDISVEGIAREVDRCELVARLASLDNERPCSIVTPMVDLSDRQIVDLARDMGVPAEVCWWSGVGGEAFAESCAARWGAPRRLATPSGRGEPVARRA